jgi:hypothetical protein
LAAANSFSSAAILIIALLVALPVQLAGRLLPLFVAAVLARDAAVLI